VVPKEVALRADTAAAAQLSAGLQVVAQAQPLHTHAGSIQVRQLKPTL
jgi:hypothetical protein